VLMRKNQVSAVLPVLAANSHTPNVMFMMNNAAGPAEMTQALGYDRVSLGFPGAAGVREGHVVRCIAGRGSRKATATIGEVDGRTTSRLRELGRAFKGAGFAVTIERNMDAWLKTHVALVSPLASALYMAGGDNHRLARTRDGVLLTIRAVREDFRVLQALSIPVRPPMLWILAWMPEPILLFLLQRVLDTALAEIALAGHASAARDEMKHLADEFRALALSTTIPTPAADRLYKHVDLGVPPVAQGSAQIAVDWRGVWAGLGVLTALAAVWRLRRHRRR
jgi:2-dehydropantoate 2-reductase